MKTIGYLGILLLLISMIAVNCKKDFTIQKKQLPELTTATATDITSFSAVSGGNITNDGGEAVISRGVCWNTANNPTIVDSKISNGSGSGEYTSNITGLTMSTTYYLRAYATTKSGTGYGPEVTFTTQAKVAVTGFKVCGSKIYDPNDKEFIVKGVNVGGPGWVWPDQTVTDFDNIVNKWKFNTIRLALEGGPSLDSYTSFSCSTSNFPAYQYTTFGTVREIVKKYTDAKVVVILEWHKVGGLFSDLSCAITWWKSMSTEFKNNPYVWFDMYNEPQVTSNEVWRTTFQSVVDAIRSTGNTNIIVATGNYWGQETSNSNCTIVTESESAILSQTLNDPVNNIVYSFHIYEGWSACQSKMDNYLDQVIAKNKCIIIGEYGVYNNSDVSSAAEYALNSAQLRKVGRIAWAWWGGDKNDLTINGNGGGQNTMFDSNGNAANLSDFGQKVWNDLRKTETLVTIPTGCR